MIRITSGQATIGTPDMHLFQAVADSHRVLLAAAEAFRGELGVEYPSSKLLRLRLEMASALRGNLIATQRLWLHVEHDIHNVKAHIQDYDRLRVAEIEFHARYADHISNWPVSAINCNFAEFSYMKNLLIKDLCQYIWTLESDLIDPTLAFGRTMSSWLPLPQQRVPSRMKTGISA